MSSTKARLISAVKVIPDIDGIAQEFDYLVPEDWNISGESKFLQVGTIVRIRFRNRIVRGWVSEINPMDKPNVELIPLKMLSGIGPSPEVVNLAKWAAKNWHGPVSKFLRVASPKSMIRVRLNEENEYLEQSEMPVTKENPFSGFSVTGREISPLGDRWPIIHETVKRGNSLILVPSVKQAQLLVGRLKSMGVKSGLHGKDWLLGAQGGTIVGTRSAAFATIKDLAAILVIDEHDNAYRNEAAPTWNARDVVLQRAKIIGIPIIFTSPILSLEVRKEIQTTEIKDDELNTGWGNIRVLDPKQSQEKGHGLWPSDVIDQMKNSERSIVILNRKGRSKLLVCASCGEIVICSECNSKMSQPNEDSLTCSRNHRRPIVCSFCLSTKLKNLRIGIGRAKEELEALLQEPVQEIHSSIDDVDLHNGKYLLGTNAALHRVDWADLIFFADYDQELYAGGYRSEETALSNLIRAVRITNPRSRANGQVIIQSHSHKSELLGLIRSGEFSSWSELNERRRKLLSLPPYGSYAEVSGPGAKKYIDLIDVIEGIEVLGPIEESWLIKSDSHSLLLRILSKVDRPRERVRVAINA
mgnify:CR=1 FL=1|tara:strand:+ start:1739 stop:3490 length:1752 start_codon:yes stop_codon:yes gene_type:complete